MGSTYDMAAVGKWGRNFLPESSMEGQLFCRSLDWRKAVHRRISSLPTDCWGCDGLGSALPSVSLPAPHPGPFLSKVGDKKQLCQLAGCLLASQRCAGCSFALL